MVSDEVGKGRLQTLGWTMQVWMTASGKTALIASGKPFDDGDQDVGQAAGDCPSADLRSLPGVAPSVDRRMSEFQRAFILSNRKSWRRSLSSTIQTNRRHIR